MIEFYFKTMLILWFVLVVLLVWFFDGLRYIKNGFCIVGIFLIGAVEGFFGLFWRGRK